MAAKLPRLGYDPPDFPAAVEARVKHASMLLLVNLRWHVAETLHLHAAALRALRALRGDAAADTSPVTNDIRAAMKDASRAAMATSLYRVVLMQQAAKAARQVASYTSRIVGVRVPVPSAAPEAFTVAAWARAEEELDGLVDCAMGKFDAWLASDLPEEDIDDLLQDCEDKHARRWYGWLALMVAWLHGQVTTASYRAGGVTRAMWVTERDERVRPAHAAMHGTEYRLDGPPPLPAAYSSNHEDCWPGDDYGCRCQAKIIAFRRPSSLVAEDRDIA